MPDIEQKVDCFVTGGGRSNQFTKDLVQLKKVLGDLKNFDSEVIDEIEIICCDILMKIKKQRSTKLERTS